MSTPSSSLCVPSSPWSPMRFVYGVLCKRLSRVLFFFFFLKCILLITSLSFLALFTCFRCCVKVRERCVKLYLWCRPSTPTSSSPTSRSRSSTNWQTTATSWTPRLTWAVTWRRWSLECFGVTSRAVSKWYSLLTSQSSLFISTCLCLFCFLNVALIFDVATEPGCIWLPAAKSWENDASCHRGRGENPSGASH